MLLQDFDIHLEHIDGKDNLAADFLSRTQRLDDNNPFNDERLVFPLKATTYALSQTEQDYL